MAPRGSHAPPAPLMLHKQKSNRTLRSFFSKNAPPVTPPATPESQSSGTLSPDPRSPKLVAYPFTSYSKPQIPFPIIQRIGKYIRALHPNGNAAGSCDTCYMRDLCSLALVSKRWSPGALKLLYSKIHLLGADSQNTKFRFGSKPTSTYGSRINLLCRTLRSRPDLADMVIELKLPAYDMSLPAQDIASVHSVVAALVMCCPNLERMVGFYPTFEFGMGLEAIGNPKDEEWRRDSDRLWQALSTRKRLKEHVWLLIGEQFEPSPDDIGYIDEEGEFRHEAKVLPPIHMKRFLSYHVHWQSLETLVLHGMNTISSLTPQDFASLFTHLPNLLSLHVSHFSYYQFTGEVLWHLPQKLKALRLESLPGLSDRSLSGYFSSPANPLERLSLINLDIRSLLLIIKIFATLTKLSKFTLLQDHSPEVDEQDVLFLRPLLACNSLKFLHWDCLNGSSAETHIANSILEGGFPNLQHIRAPCDNKGVLQAVCKPREKIDLPGDKFRSLIVRQTPQKTKQAANNYAPASPDNPKSPPLPVSPTRTPSNSAELTRHLPTARAKAQKRLENAQNPPQSHRSKSSISETFKAAVDLTPTPPSYHIRIVVSNFDVPNSMPSKETVTYYGYLGSIGSKVEYHLLPDIPGSESALAGLSDVMDAGWEWRDPGSQGEACNGLPNVRRALTNGGNPRAITKYWSHKERLPWKLIPLDTLF